MAKSTAICTCRICGKAFEMKSGYKHNRREADNWAIWAVQYYDVCDECTNNNRNAEAIRLAIMAEELGLPPLTGSQDQIVWAESIRAQRIRQLKECWDEAIETIERNNVKENYPNLKAQWDKFEKAYHEILANNRAIYWIETRRKDAWDMIDDMILSNNY